MTAFANTPPPGPAGLGGRRFTWAAFGVLLVAAIVTLIIIVFARVRSAPTEAAPTAAADPSRVTLDAEALENAGIAVEVVRVVTRADALEATAVMTLDETRTARLGSIVEGTVSRTLKDVGDRVRAGTVLAELHSHMLHDDWAAYRKAIADKKRMSVELEFARQSLERARRLLADKAISQQEVERAEANHGAVEEQLDMAEAEERRAMESLQHLGVVVDPASMEAPAERVPAVSPINGVVLERLVTPGTAVTPGTTMFVISDLSVLWALAEVDEARVASVAHGRSVEVTVAAYPDVTFPGRIAFVADTVNPRTRRVTVRCEVPNADGRLKPEMFATVSLGAGEERKVVVVSAAALHDLDGRTVVFVEERPGTFVLREVTAGPDDGELVEIRQGLRGSERVATTGSFLLKSELRKSVQPEG